MLVEQFILDPRGEKKGKEEEKERKEKQRERKKEKEKRDDPRCRERLCSLQHNACFQWRRTVSSWRSQDDFLAIDSLKM